MKGWFENPDGCEHARVMVAWQAGVVPAGGYRVFLFRPEQKPAYLGAFAVDEEGTGIDFIWSTVYGPLGEWWRVVVVPAQEQAVLPEESDHVAEFRITAYYEESREEVVVN